MKQQTTTYNVELFCQRRVYTRVKSGLFVLQFTESAFFLSKHAAAKTRLKTENADYFVWIILPRIASIRLLSVRYIFAIQSFCYHVWVFGSGDLEFPIVKKFYIPLHFFLSLFIQNTVKLFMYMCFWLINNDVWPIQSQSEFDVLLWY